MAKNFFKRKKQTAWDIEKSKDIEKQARYLDHSESQKLERVDLDSVNNESKLWTRLGVLLSIVIPLVLYYAVVFLPHGFINFLRRAMGKEPNVFEGSYYPSANQLFIIILASSLILLLMWIKIHAINRSVTAIDRVDDLNTHSRDARIMLFDEMIEQLEIFPDVGCHSNVKFSSIVSHVMFDDKNLPYVDTFLRHEKDVLDDDGEVLYYSGEPVLDNEGKEVVLSVPIVDKSFGEYLYDESRVPKPLWFFLNTKGVAYNPDGRNRDKLGKYNTIRDMIKADWTLPSYEMARPAGAFLCDTAPLNTLLIAITRAGKGQSSINPYLDAKSRQRDPDNLVINDPKGELLVRFAYIFTMRNLQVYQLNLINDISTDIFNPLFLAGEAIREGDAKQSAMYVKNLSNLFFPLDVGDDPIWNSSASNVFKRVVFGMIDYFMEDEKFYRRQLAMGKINEKQFFSLTDELWGKLTLYNVYQMLVSASAKKKESPLTRFNSSKTFVDSNTGEEYSMDLILAINMKLAGGKELDDEESIILDAFTREQQRVTEESVLWEGKPSLDLMTLFFNASLKLPVNDIRQQAVDADNSLKSMKGAEKMLSSVYGIATTQMSFFTDPRISTLTSGRPSQNIDLASFSFPRQISVKIQSEFLAKYGLVGMMGKFSAYEDVNFEKSLGKEFMHNAFVNRKGWVKYVFKGIFPKNYAYIKLEIYNNKTDTYVMSFYFKFEKSYLVDITGKRYVWDDILNQKVIRDGVLYEIQKGSNEKAITTIDRKTITNVSYKHEGAKQVMEKVPVIIQTKVRYSEKAKALFLVTPPNVPSYIKIPLIAIKQLVDDNFEQAYLTKENQKPFYNTTYVFDELGNMKADGQGIEAFATKLSIGLGQGQYFYMVLQTLQQLLDVYGSTSDKTIQGNTSNIIYLKSNDVDMIEYLSKLTGTTHDVNRSSKTVERDLSDLINRNSGKISITSSVNERPVLGYNDFAYLPTQNSIVLSAGRYPIWNRNKTILPFDYMLNKNVLRNPGKEYSLQTIPSLSSASDFNVTLNIPDFDGMVEKRILQAKYVDEAYRLYKEVHGYTDKDLMYLDQELLADDIMNIINSFIDEEMGNTDGESCVGEDRFADYDEYFDNEEYLDTVERLNEELEPETRKRYLLSSVALNGLSRQELKNTWDSFKDNLRELCKTRQNVDRLADIFGFKADTLRDDMGNLYFEIKKSPTTQEVLESVNQDVYTNTMDEVVVDFYEATEHFKNVLVQSESWVKDFKGFEEMILPFYE